MLQASVSTSNSQSTQQPRTTNGYLSSLPPERMASWPRGLREGKTARTKVFTASVSTPFREIEECPLRAKPQQDRRSGKFARHHRGIVRPRWDNPLTRTAMLRLLNSSPSPRSLRPLLLWPIPLQIDRACRGSGGGWGGRRVFSGASLCAPARLAVPTARVCRRADEADRDRR